MSLNTRPYFQDDYINVDLESLYDNNLNTFKKLDYLLESIISTEAPITLSLLKERLRASFDVKKISQKALDIVLLRLKELDFPTSEDYQDIVYWSNDGYYKPFYLRLGDRSLYEIPKEELSLLINEYINNTGDEFYRPILSFLSLEVLTQKAKEKIDYVYNWIVNEKK